MMMMITEIYPNCSRNREKSFDPSTTNMQSLNEKVMQHEISTFFLNCSFLLGLYPPMNEKNSSKKTVMTTTNLQVELCIGVEFFLGVDHASCAVNEERMPSTSFASAAATTIQTVLDVAIRPSVTVIRHDAVDAEVEVRAAKARHPHSILLVEKARSLVVLVRHSDNHSRR